MQGNGYDIEKVIIGPVRSKRGHAELVRILKEPGAEDRWWHFERMDGTRFQYHQDRREHAPAPEAA